MINRTVGSLGIQQTIIHFLGNDTLCYTSVNGIKNEMWPEFSAELNFSMHQSDEWRFMMELSKQFFIEMSVYNTYKIEFSYSITKDRRKIDF